MVLGGVTIMFTLSLCESRMSPHGSTVSLQDSKICRYWYQPFTKQSRVLMTLRKKSFENIVGKVDNSDNHHFLLFPQCFLSFPKQTAFFQSQLSCHLQMLSIWTSLKFCCLIELI